MNRRLHACLAVLAASCATPALAQSAAPTTPTPSQDVTSSDVVVTAEKRSESVQKVPISISVLGSDTIARESLKDLFQAAPLIPGVVFSRAPDDGLGLSVRGMGLISRSAEIEQPFSLFQDGVTLGKGRLYSTAFFDVDRIEFIKGTESSLLGKNSSLGAVSVVDREPGDKVSVEARGGYEFVDGGYTLDVAGDTPLGDKAALRIAVHANDLNGWVHNDATGHDGPEQQDLGLRATLRVNPVEGVTLTGLYQYGNNRQIGQSMQLVGAIPAQYGNGLLDGHSSELSGYTGDGEVRHRTRPQIASLKGEIALGDLTLVSQTAFVHYDLDYLDDLDFSTDNTVNFARKERYSQVSQELRLQSPAGLAFDWMAGFFYMSSAWNSLETQYWAVPAFPPPPDPASGQLFNGSFANAFHENVKVYSGYASAHWHVAPRLRLSGGVRFSREDKDDVYGRTPVGALTIWNTIANPPFDPTPLHHTAGFLDGNASVQYELHRDVTAYASYGHGSEAGGFVETNTIAVPPAALVDGKVPAALVAQGAALRDEIADAYEVGIKSQWLDRTLTLNVALFLTDVKDFQDNVFTGGTLGFISFNGPARSRGFEVESSWRPSRRLSFDGALTYADATAIIQPIDPVTNNPEVNASGQPIYARYRRSQAPKVVINGGAHYVMPVSERFDVSLDGRVHHMIMIYKICNHLYPSAPLTTLDLGVGFGRHDGRWGVDLIARNVTNAIAEDFASAPPDPRFAGFYGAHGASPTRLRTVMLSAHVRY